MDSDRIAIVDVETTGLSPWRNDRIVEIAIVVMSLNGKTHAEYETLINPNRDIGPSRVHGICAADVLNAPSFSDVAGDVLNIFTEVDVIAGHNVSFDKNFLVKEYERVGVTLPGIPLLCTCQLSGRMSLKECCKEFGIEFDGTPHCALSDARTTARLIKTLCADDATLLDKYRLKDINWPILPPRCVPCFSRGQSRVMSSAPPRFLQRLASKIHHDVDASTPSVLAYLTLIDRVLQDRTIDIEDEDVLVNAALEWGLTTTQISDAHRNYIHNLAVQALADGMVSNAERSDLHNVARLLGQNELALDDALKTAALQLSTISDGGASQIPKNSELGGKTVCFTGELRASIKGQPITRNVAESLAQQAGLVIANNVTKKLDILVVADPDTQSGKAKKARSYGIRILSDAVFWRMIGITLD